ncbi:MAG: (5-formylfuran-3-yl)methyl phosphate synthase [Burkholderiales bacterium]|nr:(5-formylfuran-3-yl)methyl phosphate synthase [Burkholderiales bacterium]
MKALAQTSVFASVLASVLSMAEAKTALAAGVDIIDLKNPATGALGALPLSDIAAIVRMIGGRRPVSATIGDLPMQAGLICEAVERTAAAGVDFIKIGLFDNGDARDCLNALRPLARCGQLVAVLFADRDLDWDLIDYAAASGFAGVMLDTADKSSGGLRSHLSALALGEFVRNARAHGMFIGLAGKLQLADIPFLLPLAPDYLGFRGALCAGFERAAAIDENAIRDVLLAAGRSKADAPSECAAHSHRVCAG